MGSGNQVHSYATIGGLTHDLKYKGGDPGLRIGDDNVFREYVTAHVATDPEDETIIGSKNVFLAYSHVAHDCIVGDSLVMSSHSALGGHVRVGDCVNVGWGLECISFVDWADIPWSRPAPNWSRMSLPSCWRTDLRRKFVPSTRWGWKDLAFPTTKSKWPGVSSRSFLRGYESKPGNRISGKGVLMERKRDH